MMEISDYLISDPEVIWILVIICSVSVIGITNFLKSWIKNKRLIKWVVLFISLGISIINTPLVGPIMTTIIDIWLLTLAVSTMARDAIVDGLPKIISKLMGNIPGKEKDNEN
jgi:uncharacterized membrane protein